MYSCLAVFSTFNIQNSSLLDNPRILRSLYSTIRMPSRWMDGWVEPGYAWLTTLEANLPPTLPQATVWGPGKNLGFAANSVGLHCGVCALSAEPVIKSAAILQRANFPPVLLVSASLGASWMIFLSLFGELVFSQMQQCMLRCFLSMEDRFHNDGLFI